MRQNCSSFGYHFGRIDFRTLFWWYSVFMSFVLGGDQWFIPIPHVLFNLSLSQLPSSSLPGGFSIAASGEGCLVRLLVQQRLFATPLTILSCNQMSRWQSYVWNQQLGEWNGWISHLPCTSWDMTALKAKNGPNNSKLQTNRQQPSGETNNKSLPFCFQTSTRRKRVKENSSKELEVDACLFKKNIIFSIVCESKKPLGVI